MGLKARQYRRGQVGRSTTRHNPRTLGVKEVFATRDDPGRRGPPEFGDTRGQLVHFWRREPTFDPESGRWGGFFDDQEGYVNAPPDDRGECPLVSFGNCVRLRISQNWGTILDDMEECHYQSASEVWGSGYLAALLDVEMAFSEIMKAPPTKGLPSAVKSMLRRLSKER